MIGNINLIKRGHSGAVRWNSENIICFGETQSLSRFVETGNGGVVNNQKQTIVLFDTLAKRGKLPLHPYSPPCHLPCPTTPTPSLRDHPRWNSLTLRVINIWDGSINSNNFRFEIPALGRHSHSWASAAPPPYHHESAADVPWTRFRLLIPDV